MRSMVAVSASSATSLIPMSCVTELEPSSLWDHMNSRTSSTALSFVMFFHLADC